MLLILSWQYWERENINNAVFFFCCVLFLIKKSSLVLCSELSFVHPVPLHSAQDPLLSSLVPVNCGWSVPWGSIMGLVVTNLLWCLRILPGIAFSLFSSPKHPLVLVMVQGVCLIYFAYVHFPSFFWVCFSVLTVLMLAFSQWEAVEPGGARS